MKRFLMLVLLCAFSAAYGQDVNLGKGFSKDKKGQESFFKAEEYFDHGYYMLALPLYRSLEPTYNTSDYLTFRIGICLLYKSDESQAALDYLLKVKAKNPKAADIDLYVARAYHLNGRFDEAISSIDAYEKRKNIPAQSLLEAERLRQYCNNAKILVASPVDAKITNVGDVVNTENSEYVPVVTPDDSTMYLTYRGASSIGGLQSYPGFPDSSGVYFEDVFVTRRENGRWKKPEPLDSVINGNGHDACIGISNDGQTLLIYKDEEGEGDIFTSSLQGETWSKPVPLRGYVNSASWEGSATFSSDMRTLYFASERPGGYGGRDIWMATLQNDGSWGMLKNLGPKVNTKYNEDAPFIHPNGTTLLFSSEGHNSMGGYDIFRTELTHIDSTFAEPSDPMNIGYPINTPGDDKYFILSTDGDHGYYSSGTIGGKGEQDIYVVESDFKLNSSSILVLSGTVTRNGKPVKAKISIRDEKGRFRGSVITSNSTTGKYLVTLPLGRTYHLVYSLDSVTRQSRILVAPQVGQVQRSRIDVPFYSAVPLDGMGFDTLAAIDPGLIALDERKSDTLFVAQGLDISAADYDWLVLRFGSAKADGMFFRVQIAAYNLPNNYKPEHLLPLGNIDKVKLDDGITRFTMGKFETLREADELRKKVVEAGQVDAFVTAERNGKRYLLKDLAAIKFFQE
jgi:hypothetical protein